MNILVTGGAGFIGSHTVDLLLARGHHVRILDNLTPPVHDDGQIPDYVPAAAEFMLGDVCERSVLNRALQGMDAVIHLAAYQDYLPDFAKFFHVNAVGTALLYELIVGHHYPIQKVVVASSQAVYGEGKYACSRDHVQYPGPRTEAQLRSGRWELTCPVCGGPLDVQRTDEAHVNPHNQYAISKYAQEMIALNLGCRYQIPSVALRFSITQGPRQSLRNAYSGILRLFTMALLHQEAPVIFEDGNQLRDYVNVSDVARGIELVLLDARADYRAFNVGGRDAVSVLDYAAAVAAAVGFDIAPRIPAEFRLGDTRHIVSDIGRLQALGWQPTVPLSQTIQDYIAWAQTQVSFAKYYEEATRIMKKLGTVRSVA